MSNKICSWDVGVKDLAYCILEKKDDKFVVERWAIINMMENVNPICDFQEDVKVKGVVVNKKCINPAKCFSTVAVPTSNEVVKKFYCGVHKKKYVPVTCETVTKECSDKVNLCEYVGNSDNKCGKPTKFIRNNMHLCTTHEKSVLNKDSKASQLKSVKKLTTKSMDMQELCEIFLRTLDKHPYLLEVNTVLIENQPSFKNPQMKTFATLLYSYFIMRGVIDKPLGGLKVVKFMSPSNKLKLHPERTKVALATKTDELNKATTDSDKTKLSREIYEITKGLSVEYTKELLKDDANMIAILDKCPKGQKDDLCDAFLQAVYYLNKS